MRWGLIMLRGLTPAMLVVGASLLALFLLHTFAGAFGAQTLGRFPDYLLWVVTASLAATIGWFYWRLLGWQRGNHESCHFCEGPLGWLRPGKFWYGKQLSDFRRCWNCNRPNACT